MWKKFCRWYLYRHLGWKTNVTVTHPEKFIIGLAPHTSNWDFILGQLYAGAEGLHINFLMKKEWFFWPLGPLFRRPSHQHDRQSGQHSQAVGLFPSLCHPRGHPLAQP